MSELNLSIGIRPPSAQPREPCRCNAAKQHADEALSLILYSLVFHLIELTCKDSIRAKFLPAHLNNAAVILIAGAVLFIGSLPIWPYNRGEGYFAAIYCGTLLVIAIILSIAGVI